jgi:hypothetical protein
VAVHSPQIWTVEEIAARYKYTTRHIFELIRRHKLPVLGTKTQIRFDETAVAALEEAIRCPSPSSDDEIGPEPSRSRGRSTGSGYNAVLDRMTQRLQQKKPPSSKPSSSTNDTTANVVGFGVSRLPQNSTS